jgi:hypothetical protein
MADAPSGSSWGPLEIILALVLAIGLLTQIQNGFKTPVATTSSPQTIETPTEAQPCGLSINRPHSLERVTTFVTLIGETTGCDWRSSDTVALYAQVIDAYGRPVSSYVTVSRAGDMRTDTVSFATSIPLTAVPTTTKGFLLLVSAKNSAQRTVSYRIPLTFSR